MPDIAERLDRSFGKTCYDKTELARGIEKNRGELS
jgi:hypothetical protein